jgi:GcrA cell cycle regulator
MSEPTCRKYAKFPWTAERVALLRARWSQGASALQISRELGAEISRNSVLGKIHRLGIATLSPFGGGRGKRFANRKKHRAAGGKRERPQRPLPAWVAAAEPYIDNPLVDADIPRSQRCSLLELSRATCRWPVGDPGGSDFFYCGAAPFADKPYCAAHCARAYRPPQDTTRRAPSARLRRAMLRYSGIATYIRLGGETAADRRWTGEVG